LPFIAFLELDANASYQLHSKIALFGSVTNLSDAVYVVARRPAGLRPGMPRAAMAGVKMGF